mmetsp:Transcript_8175/g.20914  ORF Transcript_8175/g.20914 Transcript_8175/m.20914 type:complete len:262 (+) Transcript_8175:387-1172(+)
MPGLSHNSSGTNIEAIMARAAGGGAGGAGRARRSLVVIADAVVLKRLEDVLDTDAAAPTARRAKSDLSPGSADLNSALLNILSLGAAGGATSEGEVPSPLRHANSEASTEQSGRLTVSPSAHKIGNELLRQHFRDLTVRFLRPFELYGTRGFIPAQHDWGRPLPTSGANAPVAWIQSFDRGRFLRELWVTEPSPLPRSLVTRRADLVKLYEGFIDTPHFKLWWYERRAETLRSINLSYQQKLKLAENVTGRLQTRGDAEAE